MLNNELISYDIELNEYESNLLKLDLVEKNQNSLLFKANKLFREANYAQAIEYYETIISQNTFLKKYILFNLKLAKKRVLDLRKKIVIYTAVTGGYDLLEDPEYVVPNCDYIAFSDTQIDCKIWQIRPLNYIENDPSRTARFIKLHPHIYFPNYEISIWTDANISFAGDPKQFIDSLGSDGVMALFPHPHRNCVYVEGLECIERLKDDEVIIKKQLAKYRTLDFQDQAGLWETGVLIRKHLDSKCRKLMTSWWNEILLGSRRDQISLPVAMCNTGVKIQNLALKGGDLRLHPLIKYKKHTPVCQGSCNQLSFSIENSFSIESHFQRTIPVDIGICVFNSPDETLKCLNSVINTRGSKDQIIVVNDASDYETSQMLKIFTKDHDRVLLIEHKINQGYTSSANDIFRSSANPYLVLLNSDTVVPSGTIDRLVACGESHHELGIVGPLSNAAGWQSVPQIHASDGHFIVNELPPQISVADMQDICAKASNGILPFVPLVNGFCFAIKRSVIESIGFFDEDNFPIGYGEEDDYCLRAGDAGFICGIATNAYIYHSKSASFTTNRRKILTKAGGAALRSKHTTEKVEKSIAVTQNHPEIVNLRMRINQLISSKFKVNELI
jgi:GT2 family glycosyltransferase